MFRLGGDAEYTRKVVEPLQALSEKLFDVRSDCKKFTRS